MSPTVQVPLRLDKGLYDNIRREAEQRQVSMAQVIRERLRGVHSASVPADSQAVKRTLLDLIERDREIIEALKAKV
jgi:hypothetical protein